VAKTEKGLGLEPTGAMVLTLPARLTHDNANGVLVDFLAQIAKSASNQVRIDAGALDQFDSSALAMVLACRRRIIARGGDFSLVSAPARIEQLARVYGIDRLLGHGGSPAACANGNPVKP